MRPRDTLTPEQERELEAIDRALTGEPVDADLRELEELVLDVRAAAPAMTPAFAARLEHEVGEGFPTPREQPALIRRAGRRRLLLPAAGSLAAVLVALVVVLGGRGDAPQRLGGDAAQPSAAVEEATPPAAAGGAVAPAPAADEAASSARGAAPPVSVTPVQRKVQRSASI